MDFFNVKVSEEAIQMVTDVLRSGWLNEGEYVHNFEDALMDFVGKKPFVVNSCTSALRLSLACAGVGRLCEVLVPTQTFVATATAVVETGAYIVFVDINPKTGNISTEDMERKITSHTVAVMPVHFGGLPCDMDEINSIAKKHHLVVIEDAAHALGAKYKNTPVGTLSDYACFSFQCIKMLTTGDGGAMTVPDNKIEQVRSQRWFGIDKATVKSEYNERLPSMQRVGFKYNMNNITAALGLGNIKYLAAKLEKRKQIALTLRQELRDTPGLQLTEVPDGCESANWLFPVLVEGRPSFFAKMTEKKIPVKVVNYGIDREPILNHMARSYMLHRKCKSRYDCDVGYMPELDLPGQRYFDEHHICIPSHESLSDDDIADVVSAIKSGW